MYNRTFQLKNENPILSKTDSQQINMYQHPAHLVNVSRKGVLCAPDSMQICLDTLYSSPLRRFRYLLFDQKHILKLFPLSSCQYVSTIPGKNCMLPTACVRRK